MESYQLPRQFRVNSASVRPQGFWPTGRCAGSNPRQDTHNMGTFLTCGFAAASDRGRLQRDLDTLDEEIPQVFDDPPAPQEGHWLPKLGHRLTTFVDWESRGLPVWSALVELLYSVALGLQIASRFWCKRTERTAAISDDLFALWKFPYAFMELI